MQQKINNCFSLKIGMASNLNRPFTGIGAFKTRVCSFFAHVFLSVCDRVVAQLVGFTTRLLVNIFFDENTLAKALFFV